MGECSLGQRDGRAGSVAQRSRKEAIVPFKSLTTMGMVVLAACPPAAADSLGYGDFLGTHPGEVDFLQVLESSISDAVPLYHPPTRVGNGLYFFPSAFVSQSAGGAADTTSGTLSMRIRADSGFFLEVITVVESGGFRLTGIGTPATSATVNGLCTAADIAPGTHGFLSGSLNVSPPPVYALPAHGAGAFTATTQLDLTGLYITEVALNFNNNLQSTSEQGTSALIQKEYIGIIVPEPATLGFFVIGLLLLNRRQPRWAAYWR